MFVAINKPCGITSHDVINQLRRITGERRIGHAGTLDPMASGVLVIGIGRAFTKQLDAIVAEDKAYQATIRLDGTSDTADAEGTITPKTSLSIPTADEIHQALKQFTGEIEQVPPAYSAIKLQGKKAYELARKGIEVTLLPRKVTIHSIEVVAYAWPNLSLTVGCGKGVYIRSLAVDIGKALGVGGYLTQLIRTRVGEYLLAKSLTIDAFEAYWKQTHETKSRTD